MSGNTHSPGFPRLNTFAAEPIHLLKLLFRELAGHSFLCEEIFKIRVRVSIRLPAFYSDTPARYNFGAARAASMALASDTLA